jgi:hypothetical protein
MKKLILALAVAAFTAGAYAGDSCCPKDKEKACCPGKAAEGCPASKGKCPAGETAKQDAAKKVESPKGESNKS